MTEDARDTESQKGAGPKGEAGRWWDRLKQRPELIITLAAAFGVSGEQVQSALEADIPGWAAAIAAGVLPLLYAALAHVREARKAQRDLISEVRAMRGDISEMRRQNESDAAWRKATDRRLDRGSAMFDDHGERIGVIENVLDSELAAYREKQRRETGKVDNTGEPS